MSQAGDAFDRESKPRSSASPWLLALLLTLLTILLVRTFSGSGATSSLIQNPEPVPRGELHGDEQLTVELFERCRGSVVFIQATTREYSLDALRGFLLQQEVPRNIGTGFIWDKNGHILTNFHVVAGAESATVLLADGDAWSAKTVGASPETDIAVLKIEAPADKLQPLPLGTSSDLRVGQSVFALGYPFGLNLTLTGGLISGLGQSIALEGGAKIDSAIQVDASINPGNSGGPLLDSAGRLIGMNTAIITRGRATSGFGFAIPVDAIRREVKAMSSNPMRRQPKLGILLEPGLATLTQRETGESRQLGVRLLAVVPGGPAEKAGLRGFSYDSQGVTIHGDIIVAIEKTMIDRPELLSELLSKFDPGDRISLSVVRGDKLLEFDVVLE
jgi:S1-C subfamily serine protease